MSKLKVYGWSSFRIGGGKRVQSREVVAARSAAEVRRITGLTRTEWEHSGCETANERESSLALSNPGTIFWQSIYSNPDDEWFESS